MSENTEIQKEIIEELEQVLIGNQPRVDTFYFVGITSAFQEQYALMIFRHVIEKCLRWSPWKAFDCLTTQILEQWNVNIYLKYIRSPEGINIKKNLWYVVMLAYPHVIHNQSREFCVAIYRQVLSGRLKKFPKNFFAYENATQRMTFCLQMALNNHIAFSSVKEAYIFFASSKCNSFLKKAHLTPFFSYLYETPASAIHMLLPFSEESEFYYHFFRFWQLYDRFQRQKPYLTLEADNENII